MSTRMHRLILAAALAVLNGPAALTATEYKVSDFLPLAVGNSWTCGHRVLDKFGRLSDASWPWTAWEGAGQIFTLRVERAEEIDGQTYYVLSDMPTGGWPPAPPLFLAGKKLRWKGSQLMEHTGTGEQTLYDFEGPEVYNHPLSTGNSVPRASFSYPAPDLEAWLEEARGNDDEVYGGRRSIEFLARYGIRSSSESVQLADAGAFRNQISISEAALIESAEGTRGSRRQQRRRQGAPQGETY